MKLKHTPGPWNVKGRQDLVCDSKDNIIVVAELNGYDATLCAVAPEMLEELIILFKAIRTIDIGGLDDYSPIRLMQLLEKATGLPIEEVIK